VKIVDLRFEYLPADETIIAQVADWLFEAFGRRQPDGSREKTRAEIVERIGRDQVPLCLIAYRGDEPVGTLSIIDDDMRTRPEWKPWLADLVVAPELRGQGIGTAMFQRAEEEFRRLGVPAGYLFTWDHESMYARLGWKTIVREQYRADLVAVMKREFA